MSKPLTQAQREKMTKVVKIFASEIEGRLKAGIKNTINFEVVLSQGGVRRFELSEKPNIVELL